MMFKLPSFLAPETILDQTNDGIYVTDTQCNILYWNKAAERITGWPRETVIGKRCSQDILMHVDRHGRKLCEPDRCPLQHCMSTGSSSESALTVYANHRDGHRVPVEVTVSPVRDSDGRVIGGIEIFRDVTSRIRDLERAHRVQVHSFRNQPPHGDIDVEMLTQPKDIVGGDYCQIATMPDGRHSVILADVMGHGVAAALYTMTLHAMWRGHAGYHQFPAGFFRTVNDELDSQVLGDSFITAFMAVIDPVGGRITYASAGHPPPLIREPGGEVRALEALDLPLALLETSEYEQREDILRSGAMLLLYSDAAIEAASIKGEQFGQEGLSKILARETPGHPKKTLKRIKQALLDHVGNIVLDDDLALVLITRTESLK
jgi:sigma-B regulation protein RsbU (phosphoserine phosphatase)